MKRILSTFLALAAVSALQASEFRHVGDFLLRSHFKLTGDRLTPIPMKSVAFRVYTDGTRIRISHEDDPDAYTTFEIYRSDGIGRQRGTAGALEVIPGVQAMSRVDGVIRHLRLSQESLTLTTFPGVSDQTIVSHAVVAAPTATPAADPPQDP